MIRRPSFWVALVLVALYAARAGVGWTAGLAYVNARTLARQGYYEEALPLLRRSVAGADRAAILWLRAEVGDGLYKLRQAADESGPETDELLRQAHSDYLEAVSLSPASGWYWVSLGRTYFDYDRETVSRAGFELDRLDQDPWSVPGRNGLIGIGMTRLGVARESGVFSLQDELVTMLLEAGLTEPALEAVRSTARVQPLYYAHAFSGMRPTPAPLLDAFAESSREALGQTPFLPTSKHLAALARLEQMRGNYPQAEIDARESLEHPATALQRAEAWFLLGCALMEQQRFEEAMEALDTAQEHPNLVVGSLRRQAGIAEQTGRQEDALGYYRRLRRLEPRNLEHVLPYARIALSLGRFEQAEEVLLSARSIHPKNAEPQRQLVVLYIEREEYLIADRELRRLEQKFGEGSGRDLHRRLAAARDETSSVPPAGER
jgi:tetratricopeptide (TPR) repeat protein